MDQACLRIVSRPRLLISALIVSLIITCSCSSNPNHSHPALGEVLERDASCNISEFIAALLGGSTILFVGDMAHGQWQYKNAVIDFLDYWSQAPADRFVTQLNGLTDITLVLECDSLQLGRARAYMESWDFAHLADISHICSETFTTAEIEYYWRLGNILHRVTRRNQDFSSPETLSLTLFAGEPTIAVSDWSFEKRGAYFVHERDLAISLRIAGYHEIHPDSRLLAYYGAAHLWRGRVRKQADNQSDSTYYVVSYLDSLWLGNANVCTVAQADRDAWPFSFWDGQPECDFIIPCRKIKDTIIKGEAPRMIQYDALILQGTARDVHLPIFSVPSLHVARLIVSKLPSLLDTTNQYHQAFWPILITYLDAVSGLTPHRVNIHDEIELKEACRFWQE